MRFVLAIAILALLQLIRGDLIYLRRKRITNINNNNNNININNNNKSTKTITLPAVISEVITFNSAQNSQLFSMPTNCSHKGNIYKQGDNWNSGHLRYRCGKFGVYEIIGCRTEKDKPLAIGETYVSDNVAHQCFRKDSAVYYRQLVCGIYGQPDCNKLNTDVLPNGRRPSLPSSPASSPSSGAPMLDQSHGLPALAAAGLPEGWRIVDANGKPVELSSIRVVTTAMGDDCNTPHTQIIANTPPQQATQPETGETITGHRRRRRGQGQGQGQGQAIPSSAAIKGTGSAQPIQLPIDNSWRAGDQGGDRDDKKKDRIVAIGTGSGNLDATKPGITHADNKQHRYLSGTVGGQVSEVKWSGKTETRGGARRIGVGPGTFTFGNRPSGSRPIISAQKSN